MEYLYLKWFDVETNKKYLIGALFRDKAKNKYYFKISKSHVEKALEDKVISKAMLPFEEFDQIYESDTIFAIFRIRLPKIEKYSKDELDEMLKDLDMKEYDEFEYLEKTKGVIISDNYIVEKEK